MTSNDNWRPYLFAFLAFSAYFYLGRQAGMEECPKECQEEQTMHAMQTLILFTLPRQI